MRETWESLIRDFLRHLKGTNRAGTTQRTYGRAAQAPVPAPLPLSVSVSVSR